jgi:hypothetical protein
MPCVVSGCRLLSGCNLESKSTNLLNWEKIYSNTVLVASISSNRRSPCDFVRKTDDDVECQMRADTKRRVPLLFHQTETMRFLFTSLLLIAVLENTLGYSNAPSGIKQATKNVGFDRRAFLVGLGCSSVVAAFGVPTVATAAYGTGTKVEFPSYIEFLIEKNKGPADPDTFLYQGADPEVLLKRLLAVDRKLAEIPQLAEEKKWSQVQGILTGPLGSLGETLTLISKQNPKPEVKAAAKKLKNDLFGIGGAATKKDGKTCTEGAKQASLDLEAFVKAAFQ